MKRETKKQKIFVGVSGGVDSSVAAYLLKEEGHEIHGVFVKTWSPEWLPCTWIEEKRDAMRVCASLGIPFHFLDAERAYKEGVADYMIDEYRAGRTPNPDVLCNRVIKFGVLWQYAKAQGADMVATGHYARTDGKEICRAADEAKDQSYFLWMLKQEELAHIRFPIGEMQKSAVRSIARTAHLFTAAKKDSQGICFLGNVDMRQFLGHYIDQKRGDVVATDGTVIGTHDGVWFYTLGERHGFTISLASSSKTPYYVVGKDIERNLLIVAPTPRNPDIANGAVTLELRDVNWIEQYDGAKGYAAQIRYHGPSIPVRIINETKICATFDGVIALGQSVVIYDGQKVVGGGIIDKLS